MEKRPLQEKISMMRTSVNFIAQTIPVECGAKNE